MFLSFLFPYKRHNKPNWKVQTPYIRFFYMQLTNFFPEEIAFIGNREHFQYTDYFAAQNYHFVRQDCANKLGYRLPSDYAIAHARKFVIEDAIFQPLERRLGYSRNQVFTYLLTHSYDPLESELYEILHEISKEQPIEAIISLCNCPSLERVAHQFGVKVIYNENGPIREPYYSPTFYFDWCGVNGNTSSLTRYERFREQMRSECVPLLSRREMLSLFSRPDYLEAMLSEAAVQHKIGLALQVEDDSNILAYSNGFSNLSIAFLANEYYEKSEILIRNHPSGYLNYHDLGCDGNRVSQLEFIKSCEAMLVINSSMGLEALLHGKKAYILGDNPAAFLAYQGILEDSYRNLENESFMIALNYFMFGYLVPYKYFFDPEYYRWRLSDPSECEIYNRHFDAYSEEKVFPGGKPKVLRSDDRSDRCALDVVESGHFTAIQSKSKAQALFARSVKLVEIEVFSYCNRKCWFCPNAVIDRRTTNTYMDRDLYTKILQELAEIEFDKTISYSRYNEPLADECIVTRLREARGLLPKALLHTNTNGDYLDAEFLARLYAAGLRSLNIQVYPERREEFSDEAVYAALEEKVRKLGLAHEMTILESGSWCEARVEYLDMAIRIYGRNFQRNGNSRGGLVENITPYQRDCPCLRPFNNVNIDYNGNVMPCCNLRSDAVEHQKYIIGNAQTHSIYQIYASGVMASWRRGLVSFGRKLPPCDGCSFCLIEDSAQNRRIAEMFGGEETETPADGERVLCRPAGCPKSG